MALEGTLKDFALPDIFQLIGLQKKTGALLLRNEADEVTIAFKDGQLVSADSMKRRLEDRLGTMLVRSGLLTESQLHDVLERQRQTLQRLGVLLVDEDLVKKDDLVRVLELQVTQIIYRVFRWDDAEYRFDQDAQIDYDRENFQPIGAESVLMEGMRILDEWPIVEKAVRSMQLVYEKVPVNQPVEIAKPKADDDDDDDDDFDFDLGAAKKVEEKAGAGDAIKLSALEGSVYGFLDGKRSVEDVMYLARLSEFDTCKAIYDLLSRDLVRETQSGSAGGRAAGPAASVAVAATASLPVVAALHLVLVALIVAGAAFHRYNPVNGGTILGISRADIDRQERAAISSRLDRAAHALESHRLAMGDERYAESLDEMVVSGYVRNADVVTPWNEPFEYSVVEDGQGFKLQALDASEDTPPDLRREGKESSRGRR